jgi:hypothetical protein
MSRSSGPPPWVSIAAWVATGVTIYAAAAVFLFERQFKRAAAAKLRAKGKNPERTLLLLGVVTLVSPACLAVPLWAVGLASRYVYAFCAFSFLGVTAWGWRYRRTMGAPA